jgi:DNA-3-methyladenine glycosylase
VKANLEQPLPRHFYDRPTPLVAQELLGNFLVRRIDNETLIGRIVETEAYLGKGDAAAHSASGITKRTTILFGAAGHAYVYQLRAHHLLNAVTEEAGMPSCVLFRALEPVQGTGYIRRRLNTLAIKETQLLNGPGKLCRAMQINLSHYGVDLTSVDSPLYIVSGSNEPFEIETSTRIGITKAAEMPYRFTIKGSRFTSR